MAARGKNIQLFLMDGDPNGRIKCTMANWTGIAYKIPRTDLELFKDRKDLSQSGVYFLFGTSDKTGEPTVYVGQAGTQKNGEGILGRLQEHKRNPNKDYWTESVVFTTSYNSFSSTEISYLANRFTNLAKDANRYQLLNNNDPTPGNITEEKESELEGFIDYAKIVIGSIGYKVFVPVKKPIALIDSKPSEPTKDEPTFQISRGRTNAQAKLSRDGIIVLAGSQIRLDPVPSCPDVVMKRRKQYRRIIDHNGVILKDILFKTPSAASDFVLAASSNGWVEWKTDYGVTLADFEKNVSS